MPVALQSHLRQPLPPPSMINTPVICWPLAGAWSTIVFPTSIALYLLCVCLCCFDKVSVSVTILKLALWSSVTFNFWPSFFMDGRTYATTTGSCSAGDQTRRLVCGSQIPLYFFLSLIALGIDCELHDCKTRTPELCCNPNLNLLFCLLGIPSLRAPAIGIPSLRPLMAVLCSFKSGLQTNSVKISDWVPPST